MKQKIKLLKSNPSEQIQSITVKRNKQGQYQLIAHRTEQRIAQLKKEVSEEALEPNKECDDHRN